jgi:hypothetical protein
MSTEAVEHRAVIFGQYRILKLLLENPGGELFISRRLKKQIGENVVNAPCALNFSLA